MAQRETERAQRLTLELEELYQKYNRRELLASDPLGLVDSALDAGDFELVSFISAGLSYGRVEQIRKSLEKLWKNLEQTGIAPYGNGLQAFLVDNSRKTLRKEFSGALKGWVHRFNNANDLVALFFALKSASEKYGSLAALFADSNAKDPAKRIDEFCRELRSGAGSLEAAASVRWFSCAPVEGSTCKRLMMWLRWMLRHDAIDPGHWILKKVAVGSGMGISASAAFIPMDTHVHQWALQKKLISKKNPSWQGVEELTSFLRSVDPLDPVRFDFAICHEGMTRFRSRKGTT